MAPNHYKELLRKVLLGFITEQDPVLAMLEWVAQQMMLIEAEAKVGAEKGKHSGSRKTYFSGARVRRMDTRLGTIYLYIPKLRKGGYVPFFVTERKRSELALGIENISASQVSEINKGLQEQVEGFRTRPLEEEYPFLWIDALYDRVRVEERVVNLALMIAHGVNRTGN
jgi:putative transposase